MKLPVALDIVLLSKLGARAIAKVFGRCCSSQVLFDDAKTRTHFVVLIALKRAIRMEVYYMTFKRNLLLTLLFGQ